MKKFLPILLVLTPFVVYAAFETTFFQPQAIYSGVNATSTTATVYTATSSDLVGYSTILLTPNTGNLTLTLPASSTLSYWVPFAGQRISIVIYNATNTVANTITIAAGTGSLIENASTTVTIQAGKSMELMVMRKPNTDLLWSLIPAI